MFCYVPHFSQGNFQFRRAKVSDTPPQSKYAIYAPVGVTTQFMHNWNNLRTDLKN